MKALGLSVCIYILATYAIATELPPVHTTPAADIDLVLARPFTLVKGYRYDWSKDRTIVRSGMRVVFKDDPDLIFIRSSSELVLYTVNQAVQRLNHGYKSGHVNSIVPDEVDLTLT